MERAIRRGEQLEKLVLAGVALTSEASLNGVLRRVAEIAADVVGARYAAIGVLAPDGHTFERFVPHGMDADDREGMGALPREHGILGPVIRERRPLRFPDLARHPDSFGFPPHYPPMHSFLGVPVVGRRGAIGDLYLTEKGGGGVFTEQDEHIAVLLAAMAASAVENARLHEESARLLEEVQQLHRSRERFFAMVNHELRNALAGVYGWAEFLVRKKDRASAPAAAFEILDAAEQAVGIINDLLDLSRLDEDRLKPVIRPVAAGALARRAAMRVLPAADAKGIRLVTQLPDELPPIETDGSRVEQILVNLLTNAIKYTPANTTVQVSAVCDGERASYAVRDQGHGIRAADAERIFDIYVTEADGAAPSLGLGLPLSRRLARLLGGDLTVVPQQGAGIFVLTLPVRRTPPTDRLALPRIPAAQATAP